jgi:hypothetical protein
MFEKIIDWIAGFFRGGQKQPGTVTPAGKSLPPVYYRAINIVEKPPKNEDVEAGHLYCVVSSGRMKWSLFICPCGCGSVVTLSLQPVHSPFWKLTKMNSGRPTLHPSVWRDKGCLSHFWVKDGRIFWCADTGSHPDIRKLS